MDNWQADKYDWSKEIVVVTGGSDGIGKALVLLLAERGVKTVVLDIRPLTFADSEKPEDVPMHEQLLVLTFTSDIQCPLLPLRHHRRRCCEQDSIRDTLGPWRPHNSGK